LVPTKRFSEVEEATEDPLSIVEAELIPGEGGLGSVVVLGTDPADRAPWHRSPVETLTLGSAVRSSEPSPSSWVPVGDVRAEGASYLAPEAVLASGTGTVLPDEARGAPRRRVVLVTLPVHNEAKLIRDAVRELHRLRERTSLTVRLAICEDGSTDGTRKELAVLAAEFPDLIVVNDEIKRGRGYALTRLWSETDSDIYCYVDADIPAGLEGVMDVIREIESGTEVAVGSRYCEGARVNRPPIRMMASRTYNWLVRRVFADGIQDHQCGVKAFDKRAISILMGVAGDEHWFWDTEVLVLARRLGLGIREVPLDWRETRYRKTSFTRLLKEVFYFSRRIVSMVGKVDSFGTRPAPVPVRRRLPVAVQND
jgi:hypothetical protein